MADRAILTMASRAPVVDNQHSRLFEVTADLSRFTRAKSSRVRRRAPTRFVRFSTVATDRRDAAYATIKSN